MFTDILLFLSALYAIKMIIFGIATFNARYPSDPSFRPTVAIIVAARNEEENIQRCMDSIAGLSYPRELLEVVIVDDRSIDRTPDIVRNYTDRFEHMRLLVASADNEALRGKTNAVTQGIEASKSDIILFTDADCTVPVHWVEETVKYYSDTCVGIVAGFTALRAHNWFEAMQAIDWFVLFSVASATIRLRYPVTAVGNNLSVRRAAYDTVGGYREIPFSVTEDYALFHAITKRTEYRACFPLDPGTMVESEPCRNWRDLYGQKKRWFTGGKGMDVKSLLVFSIPFALNLVWVCSLFFSPWYWSVCTIVLKSLVDFFLAIPCILTFKRWKILKYFPLFEGYYLVYVVLFPIVVLLTDEITWKDRAYRDSLYASKKPSG